MNKSEKYAWLTETELVVVIIMTGAVLVVITGLAPLL